MQFFLAVCQAWDPWLLGVSSAGNLKELLGSIERNETVLQLEKRRKKKLTTLEAELHG